MSIEIFFCLKVFNFLNLIGSCYLKFVIFILLFHTFPDF
jgi:hypothetical protein